MAEKQSDTESPRSADSEDVAKVPFDEIDPELVKLPRSPTRIRPIMAMAIIAICLVLLFRIWDDLSYSRQGDPEVVDAISQLNDDLLDHHIELQATPDRHQAIRMLPSRKTTGPVLMPVLGHSKTLWVMVHATPWNETIVANERYQGRLVKISDMDFEDELQAHYKAGNSIPRIIAKSEVRKALKNKTNSIADASGEVFSVTASTPVVFQEISTRKVQILASSSADYTDENMWKLALANAGFFEGASEMDRAAVGNTTDTWTFEVPAPAGLADVQERLVEAKLFAAKASAITQVRKGTWSQLLLDDDDILLEKARLGFGLERISIAVPMQISPDAYILITTETPHTYWYMALLASVLAFFSLLFAFGIYQHIQRRRS